MKLFDVETFLKLNPNTHLFPFKDYLTGYEENHMSIDRSLVRRNASWHYPFDVETFIQDISDLFEVNDYKYKTLAGTLNFEYNPIENYRMTEEGTDNIVDEDTATNSIGNQTSTTSNQYSEYTDTDTEKVSPMDTENFRNKSQYSHQGGAKSDSSNTTMSGREDSSQRNGTRNLTHKLTRSGNIGVTTSQQMLESERQVAMFNLYLIIWQDILDLLCSIHPYRKEIFHAGDFWDS